MGNEVLVELYGVAFAALNDVEGIEEAFEKAVGACGATVLNRFSHAFAPQGVTVLYALKESHLSIHTFPEWNSCSINVYTCGSMDPMLAVDCLLAHFQPERSEIRRMAR